MYFAIIFLVAHWYLSLLMQSFFQHRYAAHQQFTMARFWEKFFWVITWIFQGSSFLSPTAYAALHRMHHDYVDTEADPHSPRYDRNIFAMMWRTKNEYLQIVEHPETVPPKYMKNLPRWDSFDKFAQGNVSRIFWVIVYCALYYFFAPVWLWWFLPIHILSGPIHGALVNWYAHRIGYKNFTQDNDSTNVLPVDILLMGEWYHNNHHTRPASFDFGYRWFEIDPTAIFIRFLKLFHIIKLRRQPVPATN